MRIEDSQRNFSYLAYLNKNGDFRVDNIPSGTYFINFDTLDGKYDAWDSIDIDKLDDTYNIILYINKDGSEVKSTYIQNKTYDIDEKTRMKRLLHIQSRQVL